MGGKRYLNKFPNKYQIIRKTLHVSREWGLQKQLKMRKLTVTSCTTLWQTAGS
jgi:hypothetical protein